MRGQRLILTTPRAGLPAHWLPEAGALAIGLDALLATLTAAGTRWMDRPRAERDPSHKQPIPYVLVADRNGCLAAYPRRGSEARLHGLWSLGVGGHVEPQDEAVDLGATLLACARRELAEELPGLAAEPEFLGIINEEQSEVGRVHWGLVFVARVDGARPAAGPELAGLEWLAPHEAAGRPLELWSRLALLLLDHRQARGP